MTNFYRGARRGAGALAVLSLVAGSLVVANALRPAAATEWSQAHSDLPADPTVLFGKLGNGMRYAIKHNVTPKEVVVMRFAIDAGSLQETDAQQGLAHFLEHMAFRGSRHVPEDQVMPGLQRLGMGFGADINASTAATQTTYKLTLPHNDAETVDAGLMRLREDASELTLAQRAMDDERGVILSEERLSDTPDNRGYTTSLRFLLPGSLASSRRPIGKTDIIKNAPVSLIRDFYNAYYRPERATLIVVGDIDPKIIEKKITDRFADWKPVGPAGAEPKQTPPVARGAQTELFVAPGATSYATLNWVTGETPDTKQREQAELLEWVGLKIVADRLSELTTGSQHTFTAAAPSIQHSFHLANIRSLNVVIRPQDWRAAVAAALTAVRRVDRYGVTAAEVARVTGEFLAQFQALAANAATQRSVKVADDLATSVDENSVYVNPAEALSIADETFKDLTAEKVTAALRGLMRGHGPLLFLSSPTPIEGGQAALTAALADAEKAPLTDAAAAASVVWPYTSFGTPGEVVDRKTIADLQTTFVRFANGVRLTVKPTSFATGEVRVNVRIGNDRLWSATDRDNASWVVADSGLFYGGLKSISYDDMLRVLAGKVYQFRSRVTDDGLLLLGRTRPADIATQLQVFAAYVSAPGWRTGAIDRARAEETSKLVTETASPMGKFRRDVLSLLHGGDRRWAVPSLAEIDALGPDGLKNLLAPQLASAPIELTVVGDITVDAAVDAVARTFGALPPRSEPTESPYKTAGVHFPAATPAPIEIHHKGRADQGAAVIGWPTGDAFDSQTVQDLAVLKAVFEWRVTDQLRVRDAATYTPNVISVNSDALPGYGFLVAFTELTSANMPLFFKTADAIATDLKAHPVSADELQRARKPEVERIVAEQQTNGYWAENLIGVQADPRRLDVIRNTLKDLQKVTAADVQRVAQTYLVDAKAWRLVIKPEAAVPASH